MIWTLLRIDSYCTLHHHVHVLGYAVLRGAVLWESAVSTMSTKASDDEAFAGRLLTSCSRLPVSKLGGLSPALWMALRALRITTSDRLLVAGRTRERRRQLAAACGVELAVIERLLGRANLIGRIDGIGTCFHLLLELHGISDTTRLARQDATTLHRVLRDFNLEERLLRRSPTLEELDKWIEAARRLPPFSLDG